MRLFDENSDLTPLAKMIIDEDIKGLESILESRWDINKRIDVCEYIKEFPIILALYYNKLQSVDFFIKNGAKLNIKGDPVVPAAADKCSIDTIKLLIKHGANLNAVNNVGSNAIHRALINERYDLIIDLINIGIDVRKDGTILRKAVYSRAYPAIQILLEQNINVNYHTPDMVFPYNPTAVCVAAENDDFDTVKLLINHGADVTIKDDHGNRPYTAAKKNRNRQMAEYLKYLEPANWHSEEARIIELKSYKMPQALIDFLQGNNLSLHIKNNDFISHLRFNSLIDCKEVEWNGYKFLDLLCEIDTVSAEGFLVWYPKRKCLASADYEHERFIILNEWKDFIENPSGTINKIFE